MKFLHLLPLAIVALGLAGPVAGQSASSRPSRVASSTATTRPARPVWRDTQQMLDMPLGAVDFDGAPLADVLEWVEQRSGAVVYARWGVLEPLGIERDTPITIHVRQRPMWLVLWIILNEASGSTGERLASRRPIRAARVREHNIRAATVREQMVRAATVRKRAMRCGRHARERPRRASPPYRPLPDGRGSDGGAALTGARL